MNRKRWIVMFSIIVLIVSITLLAGQKSSDDTSAKRTVTFYDEQAKKEILKREVDLGSSITPPTPPTHKDYVFIGWFDEDGNEITDTTKILKNQKIYAKYGNDKNNNGILDSEDTYYEVVFYDTISKKDISTQLVLVGLDAKAPTTPTHRGYVFDRYSDKFTNVSSDLKIDIIFKRSQENTTRPTTPPRPTTTTTTTTRPKEDVYTYSDTYFDNRADQRIITVYKNGSPISIKSIKNQNGQTIPGYNEKHKKIIVSQVELPNISKAELNDGTMVNITKR